MIKNGKKEKRAIDKDTKSSLDCCWTANRICVNFNN